jgi:endonuclease/exonuclease/phosphatase family metal-dependent hydrolase
LVVEELAEQLGMQLVMGRDATNDYDYQVALLTRLPIVHTHTHPDLLTRQLLEVCVEESNGQHLTVFVAHLSAVFNQGWGGGAIREREVREILRIASPLREQGIPHLVMGDFNSLAPGEPFKASLLLRYLLEMDRTKPDGSFADGHPALNAVVPPHLHCLTPLLHLIPGNRFLSTLFDAAAWLYAPRSSIALLLKAGYVDCYQRIHPRACGFTYPASAPAGRIDYIFASPSLAKRLQRCDVVTERENMPGREASDHLAVAAEFGSRLSVEKSADLPDPKRASLPLAAK